MFELRCSELELGCSESAGQPQDQGGEGSKSSMIPLVAKVDLNQRPLGYEGNVTRHTSQLQPTKPNKTLRNPARAVGLLWAALAVVHGQKADSRK
jgi:hypothetical protein